MSHCLRQVSTLSRTPLQRSYDTLALASLRANMTVIGLMAAPKIHLKSVRSMQRNTPGLLDRRIGPKDMFIVLLYMRTNTPKCVVATPFFNSAVPSRHFECASMTTRNIWLLNGPAKSICTLFHGWVGQIQGWSGATGGLFFTS
eukprot:Em0002g253a